MAAWATGLLAGLAAWFGLLSCVDLFHSTEDLKTACDIDAASCGKPAMVVDASSPDVCAASPDEARHRAAHACAWLGACETPIGQNAAGACMFQALLAYDCSSNPNHRVKGDTESAWTCLSNAASCEDVHRCVTTKDSLPSSDGGLTACVPPASGTLASSVRLVFGDSGTHAENCALWGQACEPGGASCSLARTLGCDGEGGAPLSCAGTPIMQSGNTLPAGALGCNGLGGPLAYDCSGTGGQACAGYPAGSHLQLVACIPEAPADAACPPTLTASCDGGLAVMCPAGEVESLNCGALLGGLGACSPGLLSPPYDWTSRCAATSPDCAEDTCLDGGPDGGSRLEACVRGAPMIIDCSVLALGGCRAVSTEATGKPRPACGAP